MSKQESLTFKERLEAIFDPYSIGGLKLRLNNLPDCPYKFFLQMALEQLQNKIVEKEQIRKAVEYIRTNDLELAKVAIKLLRLNNVQITLALALLKSDKIKEIKE